MQTRYIHTLVFEIPEITDLGQYDTMTYESVKIKFEFAEGVRPFLDVSPFVESWIIAIEKVRHHWPISHPAKVIFNWSDAKISDDNRPGLPTRELYSIRPDTSKMMS